MSPTKSKSFFLRIFLWMCLVALTPMLIVSIQGYHCARQAVIDRAENHLMSVLESRKSMFRRWLDERKADIRSLSIVFDILNNARPISSIDSAAVRQQCALLLETVRKENPSFETVMIYDGDWNEIVDADVEKHPEGSLLDKNILEKLLAKGDDVNIGVSHVHHSGRIGAHAGYKTTDLAGNPAGFVLINLNLSNTVDPIIQDRAGLGKSGKVYLYFPAANEFYIPSRTDQNHASEAQLTDVLVENRVGISEYVDYKGNRVLGISTPMNEIGALLAVEIDQDEAFEWVRILGIRALITGGLTLIVLIFIALTVSRYLTRPLKKLVAVTKEIANGKHTKRLEEFRGKELRELAQSFNQMLDKLLESYRKVVRVESLAAVGVMSSAIVHEMRSPLSSIKINTQAVRDKLQEDPEYAEINQITQRQIGRLESMLSSLLSYAKPLQLTLSPININQLVQDVGEAVNAELKGKSSSLVFVNKLGDIPIIADAEQLSVALTNLILNAVQASPPESEIILNAGEEKTGQGRIEISVSDCGHGVPNELKGKIFLPFFTSKKTGTGLGLANVKKIIELHGGEVMVRDREGKGAVFIIILPREVSDR